MSRTNSLPNPAANSMASAPSVQRTKSDSETKMGAILSTLANKTMAKLKEIAPLNISLNLSRPKSAPVVSSSSSNNNRRDELMKLKTSLTQREQFSDSDFDQSFAVNFAAGHVELVMLLLRS